MSTPLRRLRRRIAEHLPYRPHRYWQGRADDLIATYDDPQSWKQRGWMASGVEEDLVPRTLRHHGVQSVLVPGAGTGRQYGYLVDFAPVQGFDISPRLVSECATRYPTVETIVASLPRGDRRLRRADAVVCSAVLQHVPPRWIRSAVGTLELLADRVFIVRELTRLDSASRYQWAHDYPALLGQQWQLSESHITDDRPESTVALMVFVRRSSN